MRRLPLFIALVIATAAISIPDASAQTAGRNGRIAYEQHRGGLDLYSILPTGASRRTISAIAASEHAAGYSPDATSIAWQRQTANGSAIVIAEADGSHPVKVTDGSTCDVGPTWSVDATTVAFARSPDCSFDTTQLWTYDVNTEEASMLTTVGAHAGHLAYSPDDRRLAFESSADGDDDIYVYDVVHGGAPDNLTPSSDAVDDHPDWSPNGQRIAFRSRRTGASVIWTMAAGGGDVRRVDGAVGDEPVWSPTGQWILFRAKGAGGDDDLFIVQADGSGRTQVNDADAKNQSPSDWQPKCSFTTHGGPKDGSPKADLMCGSNGLEQLDGLTGNDLLFGFAGGDLLTGGAGEDVLVGGRQTDALEGGVGDDWLNSADGGTDSIVDGGDGNDVCVIDAADVSAESNCEVVIQVG
jgi:hypothetical protein